jgi:2-polyprenyl-3-methyl-5-hydroxy-6-metoxy-1,4-benzoquinol methylase
MQRQCVPEIMDQPGLDPAQHFHALRGLARINFWSRSAAILWPELRDHARHLSRPLRVLDLATGGGDVPLRLWQRARRSGLAVHIAGCDFSPVAVDHARQATATAGADVPFFTLDVLRDPLPADYDVLTCSLFLHHLDEEQAMDLLRGMASAAGRGILVNDLVRSWTGLALAQMGTRLLSTSPVVHTDGPRSVRRAFTRAEVVELAGRAGLRGAVVARRWPCRYLLSWRRS